MRLKKDIIKPLQTDLEYNRKNIISLEDNDRLLSERINNIRNAPMLSMWHLDDKYDMDLLPHAVQSDTIIYDCANNADYREYAYINEAQDIVEGYIPKSNIEDVVTRPYNTQSECLKAAIKYYQPMRNLCMDRAMEGGIYSKESNLRSANRFQLIVDSLTKELSDCG